MSERRTLSVQTRECSRMDTPSFNSFTKNQGLKETCSPSDSHLRALKPEERLHLLPRKFSVTAGSTGDWKPPGKTRWGRWEEGKVGQAGPGVSPCTSTVSSGLICGSGQFDTKGETKQPNPNYNPRIFWAPQNPEGSGMQE